MRRFIAALACREATFSPERALFHRCPLPKSYREAGLAARGKSAGVRPRTDSTHWRSVRQRTRACVRARFHGAPQQTQTRDQRRRPESCRHMSSGSHPRCPCPVRHFAAASTIESKHLAGTTPPTYRSGSAASSAFGNVTTQRQIATVGFFSFDLHRPAGW